MPPQEVARRRESARRSYMRRLRSSSGELLCEEGHGLWHRRWTRHTFGHPGHRGEHLSRPASTPRLNARLAVRISFARRYV